MPQTDQRLAVIIPTKNRPKDIQFLLKSISEQEVWPDQIIIVDGGVESLESIIAGFKCFDISYVKERPPSLPTQRNIGLGYLKDNIQVAAFFDDDISLCSDMICTAMKFLSTSGNNLAGVSCNNISHPRKSVSFFERFFFIGSNKVGIVLSSGFQSKICSLDKDYNVEWLLGGATFWRRDIFKKYKFDEWYYGYAHCEDVDFSYGLSGDYRLVALGKAKFIHNTKSIDLKNDYSLGKMQVVNRVYFVKKHNELSLFLCYWACAGLLLKNVFLGVFGLKSRYLIRALGVAAGALTSFFTLKRIKEEIKK